MKVLVVDDDEMVCEVMCRMLSGNEVTVETDSTAALARIRSAEFDGQPYELVVSDYSMIGMTGVDLLAAVRTHGDAPICILLSGYDQIDGAALVADAVLAKPVTGSALREAIAIVRAERSRKRTQPMRHLNVAFERRCDA